MEDSITEENHTSEPELTLGVSFVLTVLIATAPFVALFFYVVVPLADAIGTAASSDYPGSAGGRGGFIWLFVVLGCYLIPIGGVAALGPKLTSNKQIQFGLFAGALLGAIAGTIIRVAYFS